MNSLVNELYEKVYETKEVGDLDELIHIYNKARLDFFENMKKTAITKILNGSTEFIKTLIEAQGENKTLTLFKGYVSKIYEVTIKKMEKEEAMKAEEDSQNPQASVRTNQMAESIQYSEQGLINLVSKTIQYYDLIHLASQC